MSPRVGAPALALRGPLRLKQAVQGLPAPKGELPELKRPLDGLKRQLVALSLEDLARFRMRRRAQDALAQVLSGSRDPELRERARILARRELGAMSWPSALRLYCELYEDKELREGLARRLAQDPPQNVPPWVCVAAFTEDPAQVLAECALGLGMPLCSMMRRLGLRADSPLGRAVLDAALAQIGPQQLAEQPYEPTLRWIGAGSATPAQRRALLAKICARWFVQEFSEEALRSPAAAPLRELVDAACGLCGGPPHRRPGPWSRLPAALRFAAQRLYPRA